MGNFGFLIKALVLMAVSIRTVEGRAISGPEHINPALLTFPNDIWPSNPVNYVPYEVDIPFTHIQRDVDSGVKTQMQSNRRLTGNPKRYDIANDQEKSATFSWWSVYLDENAKNIVEQKRKQEWVINDFFQGKSMYGGKRLILPLNRLMKVYNDTSGRVPEVRILGTFQYKQEWMHAFVITPSDDSTFQNHPVAAKFDGTLAWHPNLPVKANNGKYEWKAFSIVTWDNSSANSRDRKWNHLAFAFHLDPLPENVLQLQIEDVMDENWQTVETTHIMRRR